MSNRARSVLVTGASRGIGLAIAEALFGEGHRVFICARNGERLDEALTRIDPTGSDRVAGRQCDVSRLEDVRSTVAAAVERFGSLDTLVNNAGIGCITDFGELTPEVWRETVDVNLTGAFNCCHAALPHLKDAGRAGGADIVNIASRSSRNPFRGGTVYNATKFGLLGFSEALLLDLQPHGIRVSCVMPGTVRTGFCDIAPDDWQLSPEDVAKAVINVIGHDRSTVIGRIEVRPARPGPG